MYPTATHLYWFLATDWYKYLRQSNHLCTCWIEIHNFWSTHEADWIHCADSHITVALMCHLTPVTNLDFTGCSSLKWLNLESKTRLTVLDLAKCSAVAKPHVLKWNRIDSILESDGVQGVHGQSCKFCMIEAVEDYEDSEDGSDLDAQLAASDMNHQTLDSLGLSC